jgi:hypothetical protein
LTRIKALRKSPAILCTDSTAPAMESDMQGEREQATRERAYLLWEEEGRPDGKHLEHWLRAETEIDKQTFAGVTDNGKFVASSLKRQVSPPRGGRRRSFGKGAQNAVSVGS